MKKVHSKMAIGVVSFIIICFLFILVFAISMIMDSFSSMKKIDNYFSNKEENYPVKESKNNFVEEISQIDDKTLEELKSSSLAVLDKFTTDLNENNAQKWNYVGLYLLKAKGLKRNRVYLVYKKVYTAEKKAKEYYSAVSYDDLKIDSDGSIVFNDFGFPYAPTEFIGWDTVHGYESNKDLYEKVIKTHAESREIVATDGLYLEK